MAYSNKETERLYKQIHYKLNSSVYKEKASESRKRNRLVRQEYVRKIKESNPCTDCNCFYPYWVMDFDHIFDKNAQIARLVADGGMNRLKNEIAKCELVCANCHRKRTHARMVESVDTTVSNTVAS